MAIETFTIGQTLTAAQMNAVQGNDFNQTVSTKTASHTLVAADKGTRVVMNVASANTVTVNTSLFSAGDTLVIQNIGAGVSTVTAGTATVSSAGPLAIPQNGSGILFFTSAGVAIFYPSAVTVATPTSGLNFISTTNFANTATSVAITNVFSATYKTYLIQASGLFCTTNSNFLNWRLGTSGTADTSANYSRAGNFVSSGVAAVSENIDATEFQLIGSFLSSSANNPSTGNIFLFNPNTTARTTFVSQILGQNDAGNLRNGVINGIMDTATQFTDIFFINPDPNNISGSVTVYGLANS